MEREWILQSKETRRTFAKSTWVPLRAAISHKGNVDVTEVGHIGEFFGCGSVAFPPENKELAETLDWNSIGIGHSARPYAYEDGHYSTIDQYQYNDKEPIGVELVFEHPQPVVGGTKWILNPDLVVALGLVREGNNWVRPEEDYEVVVREVLDENGNYELIEIKREFLIDYLAARNISLRISYYRQRIENVGELKESAYAALTDTKEERDGGRFELLIRKVDDVFGGSWAMFRVWRTDVDDDEDAPVMGPENDANTDHESSEGHRSGHAGYRVEGEFWRNEWIEHSGQSARIRGDVERDLPQFIADTDGSRMASAELNDEDIGRWLWFRPAVVNELLRHRGFSLEWYTAETGGLHSTSGYKTHFGINSSDLITVYAYDVARLAAWEQRIWAAHNVAPDGKVSKELLDAQVRTQPASTKAVEVLLLRVMRMLDGSFSRKYGASLFTHDVQESEVIQRISRFISTDQASLLRLAKELVRVFSDRLNVRELRKIATRDDKDKIGTNKLLQDILAQNIGEDKARDVFRVIVGTYNMRVGDAHPTASSIGDAMDLAGIDRNASFLRQGEQLIENFNHSLWQVGKYLFGK